MFTERQFTLQGPSKLYHKYFRNEFGFVKEKAEEDVSKETAPDGDEEKKKDKKPPKTNKTSNNKLLSIRVSKWMKMLEDYPAKVHIKLKKRARKGVPDSYRPLAWKILTGADIMKQENSELIYSKLIKYHIDKRELDTIFKDISRTFTKHVFFEERYGLGQKKLFNVAKGKYFLILVFSHLPCS